MLRIFFYVGHAISSASNVVKLVVCAFKTPSKLLVPGVTHAV